jgi:pimeloyl-ACP methyl ester carboxylesterase
MPSVAPAEHRTATVGGVRLHHVVAGAGEPVLLIHGFPQTWHQWRPVIPALAQRFTVIAPDYRGAGHSERPASGYDKHTMMEDLRALVASLGFSRVHVVGHDIGAMIAYRYAAVHPDEVASLVLIDAPVPGTPAMAEVRANPRAWHVAFHSARDVAEMLVAGREREYLLPFFASRLVDPTAIPPDELEVYVAAYSAPGAMRAGFESYRAWPQDEADNAEYLRTPLPMPVLGIAAGGSTAGPSMRTMIDDIAADGSFVLVADSGHWICSEQPAELTDLIRNHLERVAA